MLKLSNLALLVLLLGGCSSLELIHKTITDSTDTPAKGVLVITRDSPYFLKKYHIALSVTKSDGVASFKDGHSELVIFKKGYYPVGLHSSSDPMSDYIDHSEDMASSKISLFELADSKSVNGYTFNRISISDASEESIIFQDKNIFVTYSNENILVKSQAKNLLLSETFFFSTPNYKNNFLLKEISGDYVNFYIMQDGKPIRKVGIREWGENPGTKEFQMLDSILVDPKLSIQKTLLKNVSLPLFPSKNIDCRMIAIYVDEDFDVIREILVASLDKVLYKDYVDAWMKELDRLESCL